MSVKVFSVDIDHVIKSKFITGSTNYRYAIDNFLPLIDRLDIQRKGQNPKFYKRLEEDILKGCIMPPITIAFIELVEVIENNNLVTIESIINGNIEKAFILDGLQRLRTLKRAFENKADKLDMYRPIFLNILICDSMDKLLYRMITLNNGQKPMTARHQIEIIASNVYDFSDVPIPIQTEKRHSKKHMPGAFKQADFIKGYLAFLSKSTNIDNTKIIEEKMDELIADKILDNNINEINVEFSDVVLFLSRCTENNEYLKKWFQNSNNLIGFCASASDSYDFFSITQTNEFEDKIRIFELSFEYFDVSKIKVGDVRRKAVAFYFSKYDELSSKTETELIDVISQKLN